MTKAWKEALSRYGQRVHLCREGESVECQAFLQPVTERKHDQTPRLPPPLGVVQTGRWLYLGRPEAVLTAEENWVEGNGRQFEIIVAHPGYLGGSLSHWWAMLKRREAEE